MKSKFLPFSISIIFFLIFIIFYKGLQDTNIYTPDVKINNEIPSFSAELFYSGKMVNSSEIFDLNKYYLLNIWSSWCVPCRQEHSILIDLSNNKNLKLIGINYKDKKENAKKFLEELGNPYEKIIFDRFKLFMIFASSSLELTCKGGLLFFSVSIVEYFFPL